MERSNVDDYLQQGIHGLKETKPDERRKFLGTLRERVVIALTSIQVRETEIYSEVETAFKKNPQAQLLLNGNIDYEYHSKYIKLANKYNLEFTMVKNQEHNSDLGLVLAYEHAIDKEDIYITKAIETPTTIETAEEKGFFSFFTKMLKK